MLGCATRGRPVGLRGKLSGAAPRLPRADRSQQSVPAAIPAGGLCMLGDRLPDVERKNLGPGAVRAVRSRPVYCGGRRQSDHGYDGVVLGFLARRAAIRRFGRVLPVAQLLLAAEIALLAGRHIAKLGGGERRRLLALVRQARGRPGSLSAAERRELSDLVAKLEPRLFVGSAVKRVSPVPIPKRLLYGRRDGAASRAPERSASS